MGSRTAPAGRGTITGRAVVSRNASRLGHRRASLRAALLHGAPQSVQLGRRQRFDLLTELTQDGLLLLVRLVSWLQPLECADEALGCAAAVVPSCPRVTVSEVVPMPAVTSMTSPSHTTRIVRPSATPMAAESGSVVAPL